MAAILLFVTMFRPAVGSTQPPILWETGVLSIFPEIKWLECEASHFHLDSEIMKVQTFSSTCYTSYGYMFEQGYKHNNVLLYADLI